MAWWHEARDRWRRMGELSQMEPHELNRLAGELGMTSEELYRTAQMPAGQTLLLERRLAALDLTPEGIRALSPLLLADLQRTCSACAEKSRCAADMEESALAAGWESYCPNAGTLATLK